MTQLASRIKKRVGRQGRTVRCGNASRQQLPPDRNLQLTISDEFFQFNATPIPCSDDSSPMGAFSVPLMNFIHREHNDDELSSLVAMASPPQKSTIVDRVNRISKAWIEKRTVHRSPLDATNSYEWDERDDCLFRRSPCGGPGATPTYIASPPKKIKSNRKVRWMSPISVAFASPPNRIKSNRKVRWMSPISVAKSFDEPESPEASLSPMTECQPSNLGTIFRWESTTTARADELKAHAVDEEDSKVEDEDLASIGEFDELLRITFTPSEDLDDIEDCESPVAAEPNAFYLNDDVDEGFPVIKPTFKPSQISVSKVPQQGQWTPLWKFLTLLLACSCLTGHANRVLFHYDVPGTVVRFFNPPKELDINRALRRRQFRTKFESPGQFMDTRQSYVGVWLKTPRSRKA